LTYPAEQRMQSHGIAFDFAISEGYVDTKYFITMESDSFPVRDGFLDIYAEAYANGFSLIGSLLALSGGTFVHPTGAMYTMDLYMAAKGYLKNEFPYEYIPHAAMKDNFPCHLMVRDTHFAAFMKNPEYFITVNPSLNPYARLQLGAERDRYMPITRSVFHQGMGYMQENFKTYGQRNPDMAVMDLTKNEEPLIYRIGNEPGQWLCNFAIAKKYRVGSIPTEIKWLPNRLGQQQEYTLTENGIRHEWAITSYNGCTDPAIQDIVEFKANRMEELYNSMEAEFRL
jgi:hypothetical protein